MSPILLRRAINGTSCQLVPLGFDHTETIVRWRNDPGIARWFMTRHRFNPAAHDAWLARTLASDRDFNWVITEADGSPVGAVGLYDVEWLEKRAEFGRLVIGEPRARGKGYARDATSLVSQAAFGSGLNEIFLEARLSNAAARSLYASLGFKEVTQLEETIRMRLRSCPA